MTQEIEQTKVNPVTRQRLTEIGRIGSVLFVGAPSISIALASNSVGEFIRRATNSFSIKPPEDALYHPAIYLCLFALGLVGFVMLLVGRETYAVAVSPVVSTRPRSTEWN